MPKKQRTWDTFYKIIGENISKHGQHILGVFPNTIEDGLPFIYSIGNHEKGLPELLLIGGCQGVHAQIINILGEMLRERGVKFNNGELVDFSAKYPAKLIDASEKALLEYTIQVENYYDTKEYRVMQILIPDPKGVYPDSPDCQETWKVPLLRLN